MGQGKKFHHHFHAADTNADPIWKYAERLGAKVQRLTNVGFGCPDGLIGFQGRNILAEIKQPGKDLDPKQKTWAARWRGAPALVVRTGDDLVRLLLGKPGQPDHPFDLGDRFRYEVWRVDSITGERTLVQAPDLSVGARAAKLR